MDKFTKQMIATIAEAAASAKMADLNAQAARWAIIGLAGALIAKGRLTPTEAADGITTVRAFVAIERNEPEVAECMEMIATMIKAFGGKLGLLAMAAGVAERLKAGQGSRDALDVWRSIASDDERADDLLRVLRDAGMKIADASTQDAGPERRQRKSVRPSKAAKPAAKRARKSKS